MMALTREFSQTVKARAQRDAAFRRALLSDAIERMLEGEIETGKILLRDYINASVGFEALAECCGIPAKSLMRMLGSAGNPRAENIFGIIRALQKREGISFRLVLEPRKAA